MVSEAVCLVSLECRCRSSLFWGQTSVWNSPVRVRAARLVPFLCAVGMYPPEGGRCTRHSSRPAVERTSSLGVANSAELLLQFGAVSICGALRLSSAAFLLHRADPPWWRLESTWCQRAFSAGSISDSRRQRTTRRNGSSKNRSSWFLKGQEDEQDD